MICINDFFWKKKKGSKLSYFEGIFFFQISEYSQVCEIGGLAIIFLPHHKNVAEFFFFKLNVFF